MIAKWSILGDRQMGRFPCLLTYRERFSKERFNSMFKEYYGGRTVQYKGAAKVFCHSMFGVLAYTAKTLISLLN